MRQRQILKPQPNQRPKPARDTSKAKQ
jgi:hypothetical protein